MVKNLTFFISFIFIFQSFYFFREIQSFYIISKVVLPTLGLLLLFTFRVKIKKDLLIFFLLYSMLIIISALRAYEIYGQGLYQGIAAQIKLFNIFIYPLAFCFFYYFSKEKQQNYLEYACFFSAFIILSFYLSIYTFIPPDVMELYSEYQTYSSAKGSRWSFPPTVIVFVFLFCCVCILNTKLSFTPPIFFKVFQMVYILLFLYYFLIYYQQKMQLASIVFVFTLYVFLILDSKNIKPRLVMVFAISFIILFLVYYKFDLIVKVLNFEVDSLNIRSRTIEEISSHFTTLSYTNILHGYGNLLSIANVNFQTIYGPNFWPADVGFFGIFFEFGLFGLCISLLFWVMLLRYSFTALLYRQDALSHTAALYIVSFFCLSPLIPKVIFGLGELLVCLAIILARKNKY